MKNLIFLLLILCLSSCFHTDKDPSLKTFDDDEINSDNPPILTFEHEDYDFGKVVKGATVKHEFPFTNTGKTTLIIVDVKGSCSCTSPSWPTEPIGPGESGVITALVDTKKLSGNVDKSLRISANTYPNKISLVHLHGEVIDHK